VEFHLEELQRLAAVQDLSELDRRRLASTPRPWDPPNCPPPLRHEIYIWLDEVVGWLNEEHAWRVDRMIPVCWLDHPHIVHELATVACLRWAALHAPTATPLEEWHHATLPLFLDRISQRIGPTACPPGRHQPHPGVTRNRLYGEESAKSERRCRHASSEPQA
jgi:hypothetical protein